MEVISRASLPEKQSLNKKEYVNLPKKDLEYIITVQQISIGDKAWAYLISLTAKTNVQLYGTEKNRWAFNSYVILSLLIFNNTLNCHQRQIEINTQRKSAQ